jgi:hypothetical protein
LIVTMAARTTTSVPTLVFNKLLKASDGQDNSELSQGSTACAGQLTVIETYMESPDASMTSRASLSTSSADGIMIGYTSGSSSSFTVTPRDPLNLAWTGSNFTVTPREGPVVSDKNDKKTVPSTSAAHFAHKSCASASSPALPTDSPALASSIFVSPASPVHSNTLTPTKLSIRYRTSTAEIDDSPPVTKKPFSSLSFDDSCSVSKSNSSDHRSNRSASLGQSPTSTLAFARRTTGNLRSIDAHEHRNNRSRSSPQDASACNLEDIRLSLGAWGLAKSTQSCRENDIGSSQDAAAGEGRPC